MKELTAAGVQEALAAFSRPKRAADLAWFFKTEPGGYGEGDRFIGATVPESRSVAALYRDLPAAEIYELAQSPIHEHRHCALVILVNQFKRAKSQQARDELFDLYMRLLDEGRVNNWDLIDTSAPYLGAWLIDQAHAVRLRNLALHEDLWHRRASIIFTFAFIRAGTLKPTWQISKLLLNDQHDLMHKAVGWMLREAGKKNPEELRAFLAEHAHEMPRTMLRYSIEKLDPEERQHWMRQRATRTA